MKRKLFALALGVVLAATSLVGCGSGNGTTSPEKGTENSTEGGGESGSTTEKIASLVSGGEPGSLHPALSQGTHESVILDHIFEGLMKRNQEEEIVPGMAEKFELSDDKLTYTFTLRDDIKWSNGDPVVAGDFEFAWKHALDPNTASEYAYQLYYLVGGEAFNSADVSAVSEDELKALEDAVGVKATDDKTLVVQLNQPVPYFTELCAFYTYYPVNAKLEAENPDWALDGATHVSNGPFSITEWNHDQNVKVVKNENYYNKDAVKLSGINFIISEDLNTDWQMYENNEIQANYNLPPDVLGKLKAENNPELVIPTELATYFYRFNTTKKPFNNLKVRKALSMAVDRQTLIDEVVQGGQLPAYAIVPGGVADAEGDFRENGGDYFAENLEEAKTLLAEGLKEEGMDSLSFSIVYNTSEAHKKIAEAIQAMWAELGVDVQLENVEFQVKIDREHQLDYEVSRAGWIGDYVDPNTFLDMFTSWSSQNDTGWTSPEYDELIKKAASEFDVAKRMEYLHSAEKMFMENLPVLPIYYYTRPMTVKPNLTGTFKPVNREINLTYADLQ
ncbi:MAG: peptide-binding protein [Clostridia bacterium]|jgi:oligopeptide transport system substrate-binding protein|nr:peptide-binding protein [Clostridia bacterium]